MDNPSAADSSAMTQDQIKKKLFSDAMKGNWEEVVKMYGLHPEAHKIKITKTGDTATHVAISDGQDDVVERLVSIVHNNASGDLAIENELGNTPLHLAAILGNVRVCQCIAIRNPSLVGIRNKESETPFFLAVFHGRKGAFLSLASHCAGEEGYRCCRRNDGETILHAAISGEYFDIAFEIINRYEKLVNSVNARGFSPLHILASKPSAFGSGNQVKGWRKLIYHCTFVDELQEKNNYHHTQTLAQDMQYKEANAKYPENYETCMGFAILLRNVIRVLLGFKSQQPDTENPNGQQSENKDAQPSSGLRAQGHQFFPYNYRTCFQGLKIVSTAVLVILGLGSAEIVKIQEKKEKHIWSVQIMEKLLEKASIHEYEDNGKSPHHVQSLEDGETIPYSLLDGGAVVLKLENFLHDPTVQDDLDQTPLDSSKNFKQKDTVERSSGTSGDAKTEEDLEMEKKETPILIAAKNGILEMVEMILQLFPVAIHDVNNEKKNIVLLAVENRQPHVYNFLLGQKMKETIFRQTDKDGNSALHLAAMLGDNRPWRIPGAALQMQWEIKWYRFVKSSMPLHFFVRYNDEGKTAREIFTHAHKKLVKEGCEWLTNTSESCSVVAALIATVAFATSSTVPGGVNQDSGIPTLENEPAFSIFAVSSLIALCFSVTSVVMFLAILTSRYQEKDFGKDLPRKLLVGMSSLFVSIASMLVSFCAGHFFVLKNKLQYAAFPVYAITCLPVTFFAIAQFPLYFDLVLANFTKVPQRS